MFAQFARSPLPLANYHIVGDGVERGEEPGRTILFWESARYCDKDKSAGIKIDSLTFDPFTKGNSKGRPDKDFLWFPSHHRNNLDRMFLQRVHRAGSPRSPK